MAAESKSVPAWTSDGVVVRLPSSYQREPLRPPPAWPTPDELTSMLWAVQSVLAPVILLAWIIAAKRRESRPSSVRLGDGWTWAMGSVVVGTTTVRLPVMKTVDPDWRRMLICLFTTTDSA